ncbi:hypothetical protein QU481_19950 [Crenobacter sp. SG2303]|uniref:Uncharacterized protein n=1 Tax=Crenobacter oryzisoli TaxID=3056844 RepID=A0ABT7XTL5_9NEIS|nr:MULTISPECIES: hypothetical protein [unclassified Crenobacter]MDN0077122.1 hypothetical protein [Crenobacter sp. SG2303]MDN0081151.1 hypothetical protein [Crenobacter sp. SG2305]
MKYMPSIDIDLDKHYNATVVIACEKCGHENRHHLKSLALAPDQHLTCQCGADISLGAQAIMQAQQRVSELRTSYGV